MPTQPAYGSLPFGEAIQYLKEKIDRPTEHWDDLEGDLHDTYFAVAGATKADLLKDLHEAARKGIADGTTLETFRKDFDRLVAQHGWTGWTGEGSPEGVAWRTEVIYGTNLRTAYAAGRLDQLKAVAQDRPFWRYHHNDTVQTPRPQHVAWDGLALAADDPWWATHYPPNGWGCRCWVESLAQRDLDREGKAGPDQAPPSPIDPKTGTPVGIDKGWDHQPGGTRDLAKELEAKAARMPGQISEDLKADLPAPQARSPAPQVQAPAQPQPASGSASPGWARSQPEGPGPASGAPLVALGALDVEHVEGVAEVLAAFATRNLDGWLPHGVKRVDARATPGTIAQTDHRGNFSLGTAPLDALGGRSGQQVITGALTKLRDGQDLDFEDEYGVECLWHEVLHNSQKHVQPPDATPEVVRVAEGLHQTLARQTYPQFLAALGRAPAHLTDIRRRGLSYRVTAPRYADMLQRLGLMGADYAMPDAVVNTLMDLLRQAEYPALRDQLTRAVARLSGRPLAEVDGMMAAIEGGRDIP